MAKLANKGLTTIIVLITIMMLGISFSADLVKAGSSPPPPCAGGCTDGTKESKFANCYTCGFKDRECSCTAWVESACYGPDYADNCKDLCENFGFNWNNIGLCCGNSLSDCGNLANNNRAMCSDSYDGYEMSWFTASEYTNQIQYVFCQDKEFLSDGSRWTLANSHIDQDCHVETVGGYAYMDVPVEGSDTSQWVECAPAGAHINSQVDGGVNIDLGKTMTCLGTEYYCANTPDGTAWTGDLDISDKSTCEAAGFEWTGSLCCSEADDEIPPEHYNDLGGGYNGRGQGACWNRVMVKHHNLVDERPKEDVMAFDGTFRGCALDSGDAALTIEDYHMAGEKVIQNDEMCTSYKDGSYYYTCMPDGTWEQLTDNRSTFKMVGADWPVGYTSDEGCCGFEECWDGDECAENQANDAVGGPHPGTNQRCIDGKWKVANLKKTWPGDLSGYCPEDTQCLVDPNGDAARNGEPKYYYSTTSGPRCVNDGQYIGDNLCIGGKWTTRTKLVASELLQFGKNTGKPFTLSCGQYKKTINDFSSYKGTTGEPIEWFLNDIGNCKILGTAVPCVNNVCTLKVSNSDDDVDIFIGASLNNEPWLRPGALLDALLLDLNYCDTAAAADNGRFVRCGAGRVWYNSRANMVTFSSQAINGLGLFDLFGANADAGLKYYYDDIIKWATGNIIRGELGTMQDFGFISDVGNLGSLMINNDGSKTVFGVRESYYYEDAMSTMDFLGLVYEGNYPEICGLIEEAQGNSCYYDEATDNYYVIAQKVSAAPDDKVFKFYYDFVSKTRQL